MRLSLIFETKSAEWVNSLGSIELTYIYEIYKKQIDEIKSKSKSSEHYKIGE